MVIGFLPYKEVHGYVFVRSKTRTVVASRPSSSNSFSKASQVGRGRLKRLHKHRTTCDVSRSV
jgi:hypothetical protein